MKVNHYDFMALHYYVVYYERPESGLLCLEFRSFQCMVVKYSSSAFFVRFSHLVVASNIHGYAEIYCKEYI